MLHYTNSSTVLHVHGYYKLGHRQNDTDDQFRVCIGVYVCMCALPVVPLQTVCIVG